jgi:hypothetical protein
LEEEGNWKVAARDKERRKKVGEATARKPAEALQKKKKAVSPRTARIPSQLNPVHVLTSYFLKVHFTRQRLDLYHHYNVQTGSCLHPVSNPTGAGLPSFVKCRG